MCDFKTPVYPPPSGWMWAESGDALVLAPIFTMTDQGDEISSVEAEQVIATLTIYNPADMVRLANGLLALANAAEVIERSNVEFSGPQQRSCCGSAGT